MCAYYSIMKVDENEFVKLLKSINWWKDYNFEEHNWFNDDNELNAK
jgi:hypothetical protein